MSFLSSMKLRNIWRRKPDFIVLIGCFIIQLSIGNFYTSGNLQRFIMEYMQQYSLSGDSVNPNNVLWVTGLGAFGIGASMSAGGYLERRIGSSLIVFIGGWIMSLNVILTYFTIKSYLVIIALSYGLLAGIGGGLAYAVTLGAPIKWFPNHKGLVIGIVAAGFALSQTVFEMIQNIVLLFGQEKDENFLPYSFVVLGCSYGVLQIIGALSLRKDRKTTISREHSLQSDIVQHNYAELFSKDTRSLDNETQLEPHNLIFEFDFWILWLTIVMTGTSIPIFMQGHNEFGKLLNVTREGAFSELTNINIIGGIFNASGRIFFGYLAIQKPYKVLMTILSLTNSFLLGSLYLVRFIPDPTVGLYAFGFWVSIINFFQGGYFSVFPTICEKLFGLRNFACNYGLLFTAYSIDVLIATSINISLENRTDRYTLCLELFLIGSIMSLFGAGLTSLFRGRSLMVPRY